MTWHFPANAHAAAVPHARAVSVDGEALTWRELLDQSARLQVVWEQQLPEDARVIVPAERSLRFITHVVALLRSGRTFILVSPEVTARELAHAFEAAKASVSYTTPQLSALEADAAQVPQEALRPAAPWPAERELLCVLTSGTTGKPKAVPLRAEQVIFSTLGSASRLGSLPTDRWHAPLPLHHVGGIMVLLRALTLGFEAEYTTHFDAATSAKRLASGEVTLASFVPVMLERILDSDPSLRGTPSLRAILLGGAATPERLLHRAEAAGLPVARSWGMSETSSQIATASPGDLTSPLAPLPFSDVSLVEGRLVIDGPQALGGHFVSSDRGQISEAGVDVLGRADDIFISGGENVDPVEIERVLLASPEVAAALVAGVPSERWGQEAVAFVVLETPCDAAQLRSRCEAALEKYKIPKSFQFVEDIPRNSMGKPSRKRALELWNSIQADREGRPRSTTDSSSGATS